MITKILLPFVLVALMSSCDSDDIGDNYYTFTGETMGGYITSRPDEFSEFARVLELSGVDGLLNAYGKYTCFLPNNNAMFEYYQLKGKSSVEDFPLDTLRKIAFDHLIKDYVVSTEYFVNGILPNLSMTKRSIQISYLSSPQGIVYEVNTSSRITSADIMVHNGVIHVVNSVIEPTEQTIVEIIGNIEKFSLFYEALIETGLSEYLLKIKDEDYVAPAEMIRDWEGIVGNNIIHRVPTERKYGFTALVESNETYAASGINDLDGLKAHAKSLYDRVYPDDAAVTDVTDRRNSLNRFIAYHLMDKKLTRRLFIQAYDNTGRDRENGPSHSIKTIDMFEYIETMNPNTLIEVRTLRTSSEFQYNNFNMIEETGEVIRLVGEEYDALNGVVHEIDNILAYSPEVERMLTSKRLRMNAASFFPEFTNNNIRVGRALSASSIYDSECWVFPRGYIDRVDVTETTTFSYINADERFLDYQGDEVFLQQGLYEFTITTLPVPAGTYEVRFGWQPTGNRGAAQLYWNGLPVGIPLDLRNNANHASIGYVMPGSDPSDPFGFENDRSMRNRGYMKAPASFKIIRDVGWGYQGATARQSARALRRILGIYTFTEASTHKLSVRAARAGEFMFDYLEFVPVEVLEYEDIY